MLRSLAVGLVVVLLAGLLSAPAAGVDPGTPAIGTESDFDRTVFDINAFENGTARWTFAYSRPLANASERDQFRAFADRFNTEETTLYANFRDRATLLARSGSNVTGREMTARNFDREAYVGDLGNRGVVEMTFLWSNFSVVDGDRIVVGDVFEGGLYIREDQRLVVRAGPGLAFDSADPPPTNVSGSSLEESDSLTWIGERQFTDNHPTVVLVPDAGGGTADGSDPTTDGSPSGAETTTAGTGSNDSAPMLMFGLVVVVLGLGAAFVLRSGGLSALGRDAGEDGPAAGAEAAGDGQASVPPEELVTDSDRVVDLLEDNGGRMRQVNIVEETGWSKSKVSMLLSDMEEEGEISKLRVGRENIVSLSGSEPDAAGSPFDEE